MPAGRPTDYTPEMLDKAREYINDTERTTIPSVAGLCEVLNIARSTAYAWAKDKDKEFSDILEDLLTKQERMLVEKGLSGEYNSTITKLILTKHGYSDKVEQQLTGKDGGPIATKTLNVQPVSPTTE